MYKLEYIFIVEFLILSILISVLLYFLSYFLITKEVYLDRNIAYECGFNAIEGQTRSTFQIHFYIVGLLFLVFDLEILLIFPAAVCLYQVSVFGFSVAMIFFIVLTVGFVLEIGSGSIKLTPFNKKLNLK